VVLRSAPELGGIAQRSKPPVAVTVRTAAPERLATGPAASGVVLTEASFFPVLAAPGFERAGLVAQDSLVLVVGRRARLVRSVNGLPRDATLALLAGTGRTQTAVRTALEDSTSPRARRLRRLDTVPGDSVEQVAAAVRSGEVAGTLLFQSEVRRRRLATQGSGLRVVPIDPELEVDYLVQAAVGPGDAPASRDELLRWLSGPVGRRAFQRAGFDPPPGG